MSGEETILEYRKGSIKVVQFNRPKKKNAFNIYMYNRVVEILNAAAEEEDVTAVVLTGTGDFYSSGNDLTNPITESANLLTAIREFVRTFILFPKSLIAIVNGPAVGIAVTTLALCDLVFASENAYFYTPFTKLGLVAEGCSSITFSKIMGVRKAIEMLLYNHKMYAKEALECRFINFIYTTDELQNRVWNKIIETSDINQNAIIATKKLIRHDIMEALLKANNREVEELHRLRNPLPNKEITKSRL